MERAEYEALAHKMQQLAREDPLAYRRKVVNWARLGVFGYWAIFALCIVVGLMAFTLILTGPLGGFGIALGAVVIYSAFRMIRRVRERQPELELVLPADRCLEFRRVVDDIARQVNSPLIGTLALSGRHNATAYVLRRPFGRPTFCIELGLPILLTRSLNEAKGIIAHELAHHFASDADVSRRVGRLYERWRHLSEPSRSQIFDGIVKAFAKWYFPRFSAITGAYQLQAEFEADRLSAQVAPKDDVALGMIRYALIEEHVFQPLYERYLDEIIAGGGKPNCFLAYLTRYAASVPKQDASNTVRISLNRTTQLEDSHPALRERIENLGVSLGTDPDYAALAERALEAPSPSAAETLLGEDLAWAVEQLDDIRAHKYPDREKEAIESRKNALALSEKGESGTSNEKLEVAGALSQLGRFEESLALVQEVLAETPDDLTAQFARGSLMLYLGDEAGVEYLRDLGRTRPICAHDAEYAVAGYYEDQGRSQEAREARIKADELAEIYSAKCSVLANLADGLNWYPSTADAETVENIQAYCQAIKIVRTAYLVERRDPEWADLVLDVCLLVVDQPGFSVSNESGLETQIAKIEQLKLSAPLHCWCVLPMMVAAKHAAQYVQPVYVRGQ